MIELWQTVWQSPTDRIDNANRRAVVDTAVPSNRDHERLSQTSQVDEAANDQKN
jgi:hypothetical protein